MPRLRQRAPDVAARAVARLDCEGDAMTPTEKRLAYFHNGFHPLPVVGKSPEVNGKGWQTKRKVTNPDEIELWAKVYNTAEGTGFLTYDTPFLDLDIKDKDAADACHSLVSERFDGLLPTRTGNAPKRAIAFRTNTPFAKITSNLTA